MKFQLNRKKEWGFFINPNNFQIGELKGEIPNGYFIILRRREFEDSIGKSVIRNLYGLISKDNVNYLSKKEMALRLSERCAQFILKNNKLPPKVSIEKKPKEKKPIELAFGFSKYDVFHLKIAEEMLNGKNPKTVLEKIIESTSKNLYEMEMEKIWKIEYAPNGRSLCKKCKRQIKEKEIRLGEPYYSDENLIFQWNHLNCINLSKLNRNMVTGLDDIDETDKRRIEKKLK
ncbi:MAG: PARP-type zinc finger-containing protein [Candidatus Thorarchaeota archaeon]